MKKETCKGVCERDIHADNEEVAPPCNLWVGHDKESSDYVGYVPALPCICDGCADSDVSAAEAYYESLIYGR